MKLLYQYVKGLFVLRVCGFVQQSKSIRSGFGDRKRNVPQFISKKLIDLRISLVISEAVTFNLTAMRIEELNYTAVSYNHKAKLCKRMINYKIKEGKADNPDLSGEAKKG